MLNHNLSQFVLELLWRATWQATVLTCIVFAVTWMARRQIPACWRVVLWALPLCRLAMLVVPASALSLFNLVDARPRAELAVAAPQSQATPNSVSAPVVQYGPLAVPQYASPVVPVPASSGSIDQQPLEPSPQKPFVAHSPTASNNMSRLNDRSFAGPFALSAIFWLWITGLSLSVGYRLSNRYRLARALSRMIPLDHESLNAYLCQRKRQLHIRQAVACRLTCDDLGPASLGLFSPMIVIPSKLLHELSFEQLKAIVEHELHHIRRMDSVYLLLNHLACCLHWFNPLAYWLAARVRSEVELAVDAATIGQANSDSKAKYGELLILLASRKSCSLGLTSMAGRRSKIKQRIEELIAPVPSTRLRTFVSCALIILLAVTGIGEVASTQEKPVPSANKPVPAQTQVADSNAQDTKTSTTGAFELNIVDSEGKRVSHASVEIRGQEKVLPEWIVEGEFVKQGTYGTFVKASNEGRLRLKFPSDAPYSFSIEADGYGPYWAEWTNSVRPSSFSAELDAARVVGGVVVDEAGQPIAGARVRPGLFHKKRPGDTRSLGVGASIKTDEQGRWSYGHLPRSESSFGVEITHPKFKPQLAGLSADTFELRPGQVASQTVQMSKGLSVRGTIVDSDDKPIQGALVRTQMFNDIRSTNSDERGHFELSGCEAGVARIVASAQGKAVDMQSVQIAKDMEDISFKMQPGGHVRIRVLDEKGQPVPKARIFFQRWREGMYRYFELDHVNQYADENGVWEWNEAPLDEFRADITRPGGMSLSSQLLKARPEEYVFTCPPLLKIVGRVIDADTKQPIENFQVIPGVRSEPNPMNWIPNLTIEGKNGKFNYAQSHGYSAYLFKAQARGYVPLVSREIKSDEGLVDLILELKRGAEIDLRVLTPDGEPAVGAKVALGIPGSQISIKNGHIEDGSTYAERTVVNELGKIAYPSPSTDFQLVITHAAGFAHVRSDQNQSGIVRLTPWARVEGVFRVAKQPQAGVKLSLYSGSVGSYGPNQPSIFTSADAVTESDGTFKFNRVIPGRGQVMRSILRVMDQGAKEVTSSTSLVANFVSGQTTRLEFGQSGCPVIGKLNQQPGYKGNSLWSFAEIRISPQLGPGPIPMPAELKNQAGKAQEWYEAWKDTPAGLAWHKEMLAADERLRNSPSYFASCDTDGRFRVDDMPAGKYVLSVHAHERPEIGMLDAYAFSVPEKNAVSGKSIDLGVLQLTIANGASADGR